MTDDADHGSPQPRLRRVAGRRNRRLRVAAAGLAAALLAAVAPTGIAAAAPTTLPTTAPDLGPNVHVFDPSMSTSQIQAVADAVYARQVSNQFGTERDALLFKPGTYGSASQPLIVKVGYYTEVAGLGASPSDVVINGHVDVYNQCDSTNVCTALNNFWRSVANLTVDVHGLTGCQSSADFWAVSQAAPMRRVQVLGGTTSFMDYCSGPSFASGGFVADAALGSAVNGSQQQFYVRNTGLGGWSNSVWNQVFSGDTGAVPPQDFGGTSGNQYTTLPTTPVSREKPFLYIDSSGAWQVFVPATRQNSVGTSWQSGTPGGRSIPLRDFYVARPGDRVAAINAALASGKHLLLTPGVYDVDRSLAVRRAGTVVLGLGMATLTAQGGAVAVTVADVPGVDLAGLTVDAGPVSSPALIVVGTGHGSRGTATRAATGEVTALQDVFFRIGGAHVGRAVTSLVVNSSNVVLDDLWAWRADHGSGVGWTVNTADTGVVVTGDDVTATGLFVEHYQKYEVIWAGERGRTVFFQNELPYDPPNQAAWQHNGVPGYAAYKVADRVRTHEAWGMGSYIFMNVDKTLHEAHSFEVPVTPGMRLHDLLTVFLDAKNGGGTIDHVVDDAGGSASAANADQPVDVVSYP
jgi:hypothetical protein